MNGLVSRLMLVVPLALGGTLGIASGTIGTPVVSAQRGPMPDARQAAEIVGRCMAGQLATSLTGFPWLEDLPEGYRVVLPLKGDPILHRDAQFPPPAEDTLAWVDLYRYDDPSRAPAGLERWERRQKSNAQKAVVEFLPGDPVYVLERGGYQWYTIGWTTVGCLDVARGTHWLGFEPRDV